MSAAGFGMRHRMEAAPGAVVGVHFVPGEGVRLKAEGVPLLLAGLLAGMGPLTQEKAVALAGDLGTLAGMIKAVAELAP